MKKKKALADQGSDTDTAEPVDEGWHFVGSKCRVLIDEQVVYAYSNRTGDDYLYNSGSTVWRYLGEDEAQNVEVRLPILFEFSHLGSGARNDTVPLSLSDGRPLPQVSAMVAIMTNDFEDWCFALFEWNQTRQLLLNGVSPLASEPRLAKLIEHHDVLFPPAADFADFVKNDSENIEEWARRWTFSMLKSGFLRHLQAWAAAAMRVLERRKQIAEVPEFIEGIMTPEKHDGAEFGRMLGALKRATMRGHGVPHQDLLIWMLGKDGGKRLNKEQARSIYNTLGFAWIPSTKDWKKEWLPVAEEKGWA